MLYYDSCIIKLMPRSTIIAQEVIIEAAFELVRKEGFEVLSARNIAKQKVVPLSLSIGATRIWMKSKLRYVERHFLICKT